MIEIGGYKTPVDGFLTHKYESVTVGSVAKFLRALAAVIPGVVVI